jgi:hypothetical protein
MRILITTEGKTERIFVENVLAPHLGNRGLFASAREVLTSKNSKTDYEHRGGFRINDAYETVRADIITWMRQDRAADVCFTTMFDLYALPEDFPGADRVKTISDPYKKVTTLEQALKDDIEKENEAIGGRRFIPYIQLHEFEALILSDPRRLDWQYLEHEREIQNIIAMVESCGGNPELINDNYETCPSRRIIREIPGYKRQKATVGPLIAEKIGILKMREKCPHFGQWIEQMETLSR